MQVALVQLQVEPQQSPSQHPAVLLEQLLQHPLRACQVCAYVWDMLRVHFLRPALASYCLQLLRVVDVLVGSKALHAEGCVPVTLATWQKNSQSWVVCTSSAPLSEETVDRAAGSITLSPGHCNGTHTCALLCCRCWWCWHSPRNRHARRWRCRHSTHNSNRNAR